MEREVGGGIGMGNTYKPMAVSFKCMTKSTTNKKKKRSSVFEGIQLKFPYSCSSSARKGFSWKSLLRIKRSKGWIFSSFFKYQYSVLITKV